MSSKTPEETAEELPATFAFREAYIKGYERGVREERERIWKRICRGGDIIPNFGAHELKEIIFGGDK